MVATSVSRLATEPLKNLDAAALTVLVQQLAQGLGGTDRVLSAVCDASFLHEGQTRANRGPLPRTPYIEHPLRNAARLLRWGVTDVDVIVAAVLHDTVEDCAKKIARDLLEEDITGLSDQELRDRALWWVRRAHGKRPARLVAAVSNPISPPGASKAQKRAAWLRHVTAVVVGDPAVFAVKVADVIDNAASLHHNTGPECSDMVHHLSNKYLPGVDVCVLELGSCRRASLESVLTVAGADEVESALWRARHRLAKLAAGEPVLQPA